MLNPKGGNDVIYTPRPLAKKIVEYYNPKGRLLEPCSGDGSFLDYMGEADWYEITKGRDFLKYEVKNNNFFIYDWAITNPPFSKIRKFLQHLYKLKVKNIVFLCPINHILGLKARIKDMEDNGYRVKEIILIDTPKEFPQSGFQWSVNHIKKGYKGKIEIKRFIS